MYLSGAAAATEFAANVPRTEALQVACATGTTAFPLPVAEQAAQLQAEADWELQVPDEFEPPVVSGSRLVTNEQPVLETGQPPAPVATSRLQSCTNPGPLLVPALASNPHMLLRVPPRHSPARGVHDARPLCAAVLPLARIPSAAPPGC